MGVVHTGKLVYESRPSTSSSTHRIESRCIQEIEPNVLSQILQLAFWMRKTGYGNSSPNLRPSPGGAREKNEPAGQGVRQILPSQRGAKREPQDQGAWRHITLLRLPEDSIQQFGKDDSFIRPLSLFIIIEPTEPRRGTEEDCTRRQLHC